MSVTNSSICPVAAVLRYMVARGPSEVPLFCWENGQYLTRERFVRELRIALRAVGVQAEDYAGHRSGNNGSPARHPGFFDQDTGQVGELGYTSYIKTAPAVLQRVAKTLVSGQSKGIITLEL